MNKSTEATSRALQDLDTVLSRLVLARRRQVNIESLSLCMLGAVLAAVPLAWAARAEWLSLSVTTLTALVLCAGALGALLWSVMHKPDARAVAVHADLELGLHEQFSTAVDYALSRRDDPLTPRLAERAIGTRLTHRLGSVFPLELTTPARLLPVAVLAFGLSLLVDVQPAPATAPVQTRAAAAPDIAVMSEGTALREFAAAMQARAEREALANSEAQARRLSKLAERMESGGVNRDEALTRLRDMSDNLDRARRAALASGPTTQTDPVTGTRDISSSMAGAAPELETLLRRLARGDLDEEQLEALRGNETLERAGVSDSELADALRQFGEGKQDALKALLENAAEFARNAADADELSRAEQEIARSRESLGDPLARLDRARRGTGSGVEGEVEREENLEPADDADEGESLAGGDGEGSGTGDAPGQRDGQGSGASGVMPESTTAIRPRGAPGEGQVFSSAIQTLPERNEATLTAAQVDYAYQATVERVLARDDIPRHRKSYVRDYFVTLSRAAKSRSANTGPAPPDPTQMTAPPGSPATVPSN